MDIYVNGLESVIFSMQMCILQTRALCKGGSHGTEIGICEALRDLVPFEQFKKREKFFTFFKLFKWYQIAQRIY